MTLVYFRAAGILLDDECFDLLPKRGRSPPPAISRSSLTYTKLHRNKRWIEVEAKNPSGCALELRSCAYYSWQESRPRPPKT